jgi:hypothetical protein
MSKGVFMAWWIYKCNSRHSEYSGHQGDWNTFFDGDQVARWGTTERIPSLAQLARGNMIIAHQTDRNELVGIAIRSSIWKIHRLLLMT